MKTVEEIKQFIIDKTQASTNIIAKRRKKDSLYFEACCIKAFSLQILNFIEDDESVNDAKDTLTTQRLSLLIGTFVGQLSNLLNQVGCELLTTKEIYKNLLDIQNSTALQVHNIFYKGNKRDVNDTK